MSHADINIEAVRDVAKRIAPFAHKTPVTTCSSIDRIAGRSLFFKCEHLQKVGAFKFRGACNAVMKLSDEDAAHGVVTHSSGNHAQALALAARVRGIEAHIVMPTSASAVKRAAVLEYGATVIECEPNLESREMTATRIQQKTGATFVHPYNNADVIAGQGTVALELLEQVADLDAIVAPIGGGGLISGICVAAKSLKPSIRIFGAEPNGADDAARSKAAGKLIPQTRPNTIADGLLTSLGDLTWPHVRDHVECVITVSDDEIISAMRLAWQRAKLLIEPSAAVTVAAVLTHNFREEVDALRIGLILSGGNVDLDKLPWCQFISG